MDETSVRSEQVTARFGSRAEAELVATKLKEIGISPAGITVREGADPNHREPRFRIGEGILLGVVIGGLLGGLMGAIFAPPGQVLYLLGNTFKAELAGSILGIEYGLIVGVVLGVVVGILAKSSSSSPIHDFNELMAEEAFIEVQVPASLVGRAREIINYT